MALNCGIVGLPNVGKSTLFKALTRNPAEVANYPFCTIQPNIGLVSVPDNRLEAISSLIKTQKVIPTVVEFVDIAGLVKGASKGEGLGNQFLGNIRNVGMIVHVLRCFDDENIIHVEGKTDPIRDIETIDMELCFSDLEILERKKERISKQKRMASKEDLIEISLLEDLIEQVYCELENGKPIRLMSLSEDQKNLLQDLGLITQKKVLYVCNVNENDLLSGNSYVQQVQDFAKSQGSEMSIVCAKIESEISELETDEERISFLEDLGLKESSLLSVIRKGYTMLGMQTFFTAGEKEVRAWTFQRGMKAPQAAGIIHSDFEKGFIRAEVYHCEDLFDLGSLAKIKSTGKLRLEGKDYFVKDGDVMHFRFNV